MNYIFNDIERNIIEELKNARPKRIWTDYVSVVFEFENYFIELEYLPEIAYSQNKSDEAMTAKFRKHNRTFEPQNTAKVLSENEIITQINSVRTLLYFTNSITEPKKVKKMDSR